MRLQAIDTTLLVTSPSKSSVADGLEVRREAMETIEFGACPPAFASQEAISAEVKRGLRFVRIRGAVELQDAVHAAESLRLIRDLTSCQVRVDWCLVPGCEAFELLGSFHPPSEDSDLPRSALESWIKGFKYGQLYWRAGPGFAIIRDARCDAINHFTLDEPEYVDAVNRGHLGRGLAYADASALQVLSNEGLLIQLSGHPVFLPYRMKHWPIPFNAV